MVKEWHIKEWRLTAKETSEGWPLLPVETKTNWGSKSTNKRGSSLVGSLGFSCRYKRFLSCLGCYVGPVKKCLFPHRTLFQFICSHRPASWAGSRAGLPLSLCLCSSHWEKKWDHTGFILLGSAAPLFLCLGNSPHSNSFFIVPTIGPEFWDNTSRAHSIHSIVCTYQRGQSICRLYPSPPQPPLQCLAPTLQRQFCLYIPFLGIARPQPQFSYSPYSCVCERFIYSQDRSTYFLQQKRQTHRGYILYCIIRSQTHECGNWDWGPDIPFLGVFVSNFRHFVFAVYLPSLYS